jgi:hypothetical protein
MLTSLLHSIPEYPAISYQPASHSRRVDPTSLFPTTLAIRVAVRGENGLLTLQAMRIAPGIRSEELVHQLLLVRGAGNCSQTMNQRLLDILLMRRIVICNVVLSVVGATRSHGPHDMPFSLP